MSRLAIRTYLETLLQANCVKCNVLGFEPKAEALDNLVFVKTMVSREERASFPRGQAMKITTYQVLLWCEATDPDERVAQRYLDEMLAELQGILRATTEHVALTDPVTGAASQLYEVGEAMDVKTNETMSMDITRDGESDITATATLVVQLKETFRG